MKDLNITTGRHHYQFKEKPFSNLPDKHTAIKCFRMNIYNQEMATTIKTFVKVHYATLPAVLSLNSECSKHILVINKFSSFQLWGILFRFFNSKFSRRFFLFLVVLMTQVGLQKCFIIVGIDFNFHFVPKIFEHKDCLLSKTFYVFLEFVLTKVRMYLNKKEYIH